MISKWSGVLFEGGKFRDSLITVRWDLVLCLFYFFYFFSVFDSRLTGLLYVEHERRCIRYFKVIEEEED